MSNRRRTKSYGEHHDRNDQCKIVNGVSVFRPKDHWQQVSIAFNRYRHSTKFCDVELKVGNETFKAHRLILAANSLYFEAMFTNELSEKEQNLIEIHDVSPKIFLAILNYIYNGEVAVVEDNVQELLAAANMLQIQQIVRSCCTFLQKQLHPSNCVGIYRFAELHACTLLRLEAKRFIERHFAEVVQEEEFFDLPKETLKNFLRSEGLSIDSEFQVLEATVRWMLKDVGQKREYLSDLMQTIRLPVIPPKQLEAFIKDCPDAQIKDELKQLSESYKEEHQRFEHERKQQFLATSSIPQMPCHGIQWQPRMCARKSVYVIGGVNHSGHRWSDGRSLNTSECLDILKSQWKSLPPMQYPRSSHGIAALNGLIFVAGGESDSLIYDNVEIYDRLDNQWTRGCNLRQARSCFGMCSLDNYLYALGGWIGNAAGNGIERFNSKTNEWQIYDKLVGARYAMGVLAHEGLIYIIGGFDEHNNAIRTLESYNPVTKEFQKLASMNEKRGYFGCTVLHNQIYVAGGMDGKNTLRSVERYNILDNRWSNVSKMKTARIAPSVAAVNDYLLVIGGRIATGDEYTIPNTLESVEIYDPESNQWREGTPMPTSRCEAAVVVM